MNNKPLIAVILVLLTLGGVVFYTQSNKQAPEKNKAITDQQVLPTETKEEKTYTLAEVANHSSESDCWMAIEGKVYDVTDFVSGHPGGKSILNGCGKDATILFNERPSDNKGPHPDQAKAALEKLYLGNLSD